MGEPRVFNLKDKHRIPIPRGAVYCGRGSPYGNPFIAGTHGSRKHVIARFVKEVLPTLDVSALRGKHLVCHCVPLDCHCTPILEKANEPGYEEGDLCWRDQCEGILIEKREYCHCSLGHAPCGGCMYPAYCPECGVYAGPDGEHYGRGRYD